MLNRNYEVALKSLKSLTQVAQVSQVTRVAAVSLAQELCIAEHVSSQRQIETYNNFQKLQTLSNFPITWLDEDVLVATAALVKTFLQQK